MPQGTEPDLVTPLPRVSPLCTLPMSYIPPGGTYAPGSAADVRAPDVASTQRVLPAGVSPGDVVVLGPGVVRQVRVVSPTRSDERLSRIDCVSGEAFLVDSAVALIRLHPPPRPDPTPPPPPTTTDDVPTEGETL